MCEFIHTNLNSRDVNDNNSLPLTIYQLNELRQKYIIENSYRNKDELVLMVKAVDDFIKFAEEN